MAEPGSGSPGPGKLPSAKPANTRRGGGIVDLAAEWGELLRTEAAGYARVALANIRREFPADVHHMMSGPGDGPFRPRARTPVFYGSLDWHSCVEMHWLLIRLLRVAADHVPVDQIRALLHAQFDARKLDAEAATWLRAIAPLEEALTTGFLAWLPKATYPVRYGMHSNSAFAFSTLLP